MSAATILNGTYYIISHVGTYLTFTDTNSTTNLTTFQYLGDLGQQWEVAPGTASGISNPAYTIKNVKYQTYVSYTATNNPGDAVGQSSSPLNWFVNISTVRDRLPNSVCIFPCCGDNNNNWQLLPVSNSTGSTGSGGASGSGVNITALIASLSVVIPVCIVLVFIVVRQRRRPKGYRSTGVMGSH
ncbi:hypothetical protein BU15DRAFT_67273 [Melanogaster broomeanus]|nr:hypothetical protein BU15DRAFT_67273 [Melanogaster broomeanus]